MPTITKLSDVVTPDELRSMVGAAVKEMKDGVIDLPIYLRTVKVQSDRTDKRAWGMYKALGDDPATYTDDESTFSELFLTFIGWTTARAVAIALPTALAQTIGDGKAQLQRNDDAGTSTLANIDQQLANVVPLLVDAINALQPPVASTVTTAFALGRFGATGDPVTGS